MPTTCIKTLPQGSEPCTHNDLYTSDLLGERIEVRGSWQVGNQGVPDDPHSLFDPGIGLHKPLTLAGILLTKQLQSSYGTTGTAYREILLICPSFPVEAKHLEWCCQNQTSEPCQRAWLTRRARDLFVQRER